MCTADSPSPEFVSLEAVLAIHAYLIEKFGGSTGLRDEGLLDSALSQPYQSFFGEFLHPTIYEQAAAYLYHLAKNHAFIDGNKRVALATTITFFKMNGYRFCLPKQEAEALVLDVVAGKLDKQEVAAIFEVYVLPDNNPAIN
ncbi:MAG TPA: type II toxin-antitoxin system death-on-curing family toxin [Leptolyngbyaceae cyanobacterium]